MKSKPICPIIIRENLNRVQTGEELTMPLSILNGEFKKKYAEIYGEFEKMSPEEVKAHKKAYYQRPEVKAYQKVYHQRPEVKAHKKAYHQRPEVKAHYKAYQKAYYQRKKKEE